MLEADREPFPPGACVIVAILANLFRLLLLPFYALRRARAAPKGAFVSLEIDGSIVDLPRPSLRRWFFRRSGRPSLSIARLKELGRVLAEDREVKGLLLEVRGLSAGPAVLASLRDVLCEVRASGKDVVAYLPLGADNRTLYVASAARLIIVGPETMVAPLGYAAHGRYVRRALERVGVEPEVFSKGMYKSAGEGLVRDSMSDEQREQLGAVLETHHDALVTALMQGRRVDRETATRWIDEAPHSAAKARELGMVDAIAYEDELPRLLAATAETKGADAVPASASYRGTSPAPASASTSTAAAPPLELVPAGRYFRARRPIPWRPLRPRKVIGVIEVHGPIVSRARLELGSMASEEATVAALRAARESRAVRGVVLHIDSPGGSALASDRIYHEVTRVAEVKPVVAYLSNVAASGGYYIAAGAQTVVAQPQTVTGSIGVVSARFVVGPLLERLGVFTDVVKRGARADLFSPSRRLDEAERALFDQELDAFYRTFLNAVAKGRRRPVEAIEPLAQGRIYSGVDAHARGLVDYLGGFDRAMHELRELIGPEGKGLEPRIVRSPRTMPRPPRLPAPLHALLGDIGLGPLLEVAHLAFHVEIGGERILAYWRGIEI
jgi:protease-4